MSQIVRLKEKKRVSLPCPVCHFNEALCLYSYFYEICESNILKCGQCGHCWMHPAPLRELHLRNMNSLDDSELFHSSLLRWLHKHFIIFPEIRRIRRLKGLGRLRLLDVACGTGWALSIWQRKNFCIKGLEASNFRSKICREKYGLDVTTGFIEKFDAREKFDVITMRHSLEHMEDPVAILQKINFLLKDDGILSVTVPNTNSISRYLFQEHYAWVLPWHLHFYTPKTLEALANKAGFLKVASYQRPSALYYVDSVIDSFKRVQFIQNVLKKIPRVLLTGLLSPIALLGWIFCLGDNLTIMVKKRSDQQGASEPFL